MEGIEISEINPSDKMFVIIELFQDIPPHRKGDLLHVPWAEASKHIIDELAKLWGDKDDFVESV